MARIITVGGNGGSYEAVPEDYYMAEVSKIEFVADQKNHFTGELEDRWKLFFKVTEGEHVGKTFTGLAKNSTHPKSKLRDWLKAFFGPLKEGDPIDIDDIVDRPCMIYISHGSTLRDDGQPWCNVSKVQKKPNSGVELMSPLSESEVNDRDGDDSTEDGTEEPVVKKTKKTMVGKKKTAKKKPKVTVPEGEEEEELDVEW